MSNKAPAGFVTVMYFAKDSHARRRWVCAWRVGYNTNTTPPMHIGVPKGIFHSYTLVHWCKSHWAVHGSSQESTALLGPRIIRPRLDPSVRTTTPPCAQDLQTRPCACHVAAITDRAAARPRRPPLSPAHAGTTEGWIVESCVGAACTSSTEYTVLATPNSSQFSTTAVAQVSDERPEHDPWGLHSEWPEWRLGPTYLLL